VAVGSNLSQIGHHVNFRSHGAHTSVPVERRRAGSGCSAAPFRATPHQRCYGSTLAGTIGSTTLEGWAASL
jgi:hypothetical protein